MLLFGSLYVHLREALSSYVFWLNVCNIIAFTVLQTPFQTGFRPFNAIKRTFFVEFPRWQLTTSVEQLAVGVFCATMLPAFLF